MHISRTHTTPGKPKYNPASAVLLTEVGKLACSLVLAIWEMRQSMRSETLVHPPRKYDDTEGSSSLAAILRRIRQEVFGPGWTKLALPAALFTGQGNLAYYASSNLSVPVFMLTYQLSKSPLKWLNLSGSRCVELKLVTSLPAYAEIPATALCSVLMLSRRLSRRQWLCIAMLTLGVGIVQLATGARNTKTSVGGSGPPESHGNQLLGLGAVCLACLSSGLSSVYFEKVLKQEHHSTTSTANPEKHYEESYEGLHVDSKNRLARSRRGVEPCHSSRQVAFSIRNIQLSLFSLFAGLIIYLTTSSSIHVAFFHFLDGFCSLTYLLIVLQICGGLLGGLVIQHADNIAKSFSTSMSILLSFAASMFLFDYRLSWGVLLGSAAILGSTWLFDG